MLVGTSEQSLYSTAQINQYLSRIAFPSNKYPRAELQLVQTDGGLSYLEKLMKYQLSAIPFENLSLHYSQNPGVSLDSDEIFFKIIEKHRGGYCMELNFLFGRILKSMGYEVISTGARVASSGLGSAEDPLASEALGWSHQINLVRIKSIIYTVDVGFGGIGPTNPLPLVLDVISPWGATDAQTRLTYHHCENSFVQGTWSYEHRISSSSTWTPVYYFGLTKFTAKDFDIMNFAVSTRRTSIFTKSIMCTKNLFSDNTDDIVGMLILSNGTLKKRVQGTSEILAECKNEADRLEVLDSYFGINLSTKEQQGIKGTVTDLG